VNGTYFGDFPVNFTSVCIPFSTYSASLASPITMTNFANTDVKIYKDFGTTERSSANGITVTTNFDSGTLTLGLHAIVIDLSDNTDAGFYAAGHEYQVAVADVTVDGLTMRFWAASFSIERAGGVLALIKGGTITIATVTNQLTAAAVAAGVWKDAVAGDFTVASSIGKALYINDVAPGGSGGHMISGVNAGTTTLGALTVTGVSTFTGNVILSDGLTISAPSTLNRAGISVTGNGTGSGLAVTGGSTGHGILATSGSGATGNGIFAVAASTDGSGMRITGAGAFPGLVVIGGSGVTGAGILASAGGGDNAGIVAAGFGAGAGLQVSGGSTGPGFSIVGGGVSGDGIKTTTISGHGMNIAATGASKHGIFVTGGTAGVSDGIRAVAGTGGVDIRGNITGNITGTLDTVTTTINVTTVNGLAANVITAASIADAAIDRATFAADTGLQSIRSNTAQAGSATSITLDAGASALNNFYNNNIVYITGGTGVGQARFITAYVGATKVATVGAWTTNPDNTSTFAILPFDAVTVPSAPTAAQNAAAVWQDATAGDFTVPGSIGKSLFTGGVVPGGVNGLVIAGANAATTFATLTVTGALSINGVSNVSQTGDSFALANGASGFVAIKTDTAAILLDTTQIKADLPTKITKNVALPKFEFFMVSSTDHVTGAVGLVITAVRSLDGAAFAPCANPVVEIGAGWYAIDFAASDLNANTVGVEFTAVGADPRNLTIIPQPD
jgi:hypothetical protein